MTGAVVFAGAKGGQGTTTVAAAAALFAAGHGPTTLVCDRPAEMATLLGIPRPVEDRPVRVTETLWLATEVVDGTDTAIIDDPADTEPDPAGEAVTRYLVVRGPCYLALSAAVARPGPTPDGIVVVAEPGRSLTARDVVEVTGVPVVAAVEVSDRVARAVDAGLLLARLHHLAALAPLRTLMTPPQPPTQPPPDPRPPAPSRQPATPRSTTHTDLPFPQCGNGRVGGTRGKTGREHLHLMHVDQHATPTGRPHAVLNIGRLAPGAADYYVGEVATSPEDYYTGQGEAPGRWVGSLAAQIGLVGAVDPDAFRAVLEGRHPHTGETLVSGRSGTCQARSLTHPTQPSLFDDDHLDVAQVAARIRMTTRRVRQLLAAGVRAANDGSTVAPGTTLVGQRIRKPGQRGPLAWSVPRHAVERYEAERRTVKARPGYDLTLRPPKSVSVLWALADPARRQLIRDAHREAVNAVVDYYERHATYARRPTGKRDRIECDGLIAAAFDHRSSRAGDPLLHTHVVCANLTFTAEGRWQAVDGRPIFAHAHAAGYLYQAHLRHLLTTRAGLRFGPVRNGYAEIDGVPRAVIDAFSKRRDEIEQVVAESGYTSARARQVATLSTRAPKDHDVDHTALEERWRAEAAEAGFGPDRVAACFAATAQPSEPPRAAELFAWLAGPDGLTAQASTFSRHDVVEAIAERAGATLPAQTIDEWATAFIASDHVHTLPAAPGEQGCGLARRDGTTERAPDLARYTTPGLLSLERQLLDWAAKGFAAPVPAADPAAVDAALAARPELSTEQAAMVRAVCGHTPAIQPVAGRPGSGKTHATAACVDAFLASGVPVVGCALSAVAAAELESATSLLDRTRRPATTIARLLIDAEPAGLAPGTVVIVDEASMVGTRDLTRIAALAAAAGGAVKLIGDPDQHGPVATGGLFARLIADHAERVPRLVANNRQHDPGEQRAIEEYRQQLIELSLSRYDSAGKITRSPTAADSYDTMAADWFAHVTAGGTDPMIAGTNRVRRALNDRARTHMAAAGRLTGPAITIDGRTFQAGDWVVARRNHRGLRSIDNRHFVKNGSAGTIAAVHPDTGTVTVDLAVEGTIALPAAYLQAGHLEHGYARTSYGVQGATLDHALYHPGDTSSFEEGYVALTRGRIDTRIYLVDGHTAPTDDSHPGHDRTTVGLETIAESLEQRRTKHLALDTDPLAAASADTFAGATLAQLRTERDRLHAILHHAPPPVDDATASATRRRDALLARSRALTDHPPSRHPLRPHRRRRTADTAKQLAGIDQALARLDAQLARLEQRAEQRQSYLADHAGDIERLRMVYRAELTREIQLRAAAIATPDPPLTQRLGPAPAEPRRYQLWRDAHERAAVHNDRYAHPLSAGRPAGDRAAELSYDRVREAFRAFDDAAERPAPEREVLLEV